VSLNLTPSTFLSFHSCITTFIILFLCSMGFLQVWLNKTTDSECVHGIEDLNPGSLKWDINGGDYVTNSIVKLRMDLFYKSISHTAAKNLQIILTYENVIHKMLVKLTPNYVTDRIRVRQIPFLKFLNQN
jgi:hypothetical protein